MKEETRSFYLGVVETAVDRIVRGLDEALDLGALARSAALSPLHFHRIFRGMVGETPLELHRRLRLERAAFRLSSESASVTSIAFDAGYETHESFTRAFRDAYAASPSEFRELTRLAREARARAQPFQLAARCGVHFTERPEPAYPISIIRGEHAMHVDIRTLQAMRIAAVSHRGPYNTIAEACQRLGEIAEPAGLLTHEGAALVAIYHDDPEATPPAELRSDAGIVVPKDVRIPPDLKEVQIPAGRYACTTHHGTYTLLGDTWARLMGEWLPRSGHRVADGVSFEVYRNTPGNAAEPDLRTELYVPLA